MRLIVPLMPNCMYEVAALPVFPKICVPVPVLVKTLVESPVIIPLNRNRPEPAIPLMVALSLPMVSEPPVPRLMTLAPLF